jgi:quercetin dioxygenase-like cupin family protein
MRTQWLKCLVAGAIFFAAAFVSAQEVKFMAFPGFPTCTTGAVRSGDPAKGPSIISAKATAGCVVPWHWHSPNEHLMFVSGVARVEMKDGKTLTLRAGGYGEAVSKHVHRFTCKTKCSFYVYADGPFDIHYVNSEGAEIPPAEAIKAVKETAATP